ncbi:hypothetical protein F4778DRAFT_779503 [Xylariomycetidae sp. FL2044]|nr:hypothetical protein F4778DRAFT_779503 [Xylariomycetidae sp. FL2044]
MDAVIAGGRPLICPDCGKQYRGSTAAKSYGEHCKREHIGTRCTWGSCTQLCANEDGLADHLHQHNNAAADAAGQSRMACHHPLHQGPRGQPASQPEKEKMDNDSEKTMVDDTDETTMDNNPDESMVDDGREMKTMDDPQKQMMVKLDRTYAGAVSNSITWTP